MTFRLPSNPSHSFARRARARASWLPGWVLAGLLVLGCGQPLAAADPEILQQPVSGLAGYGEPFGFDVLAAGTAPLSYQWYLNDAVLDSQTNRSLYIASVTNTDAGNYFVLVTNSIGSVTSAPVSLTIASPPRTITTGTVLGGANATVPVLLSANGRENRVTFTLGFDTNVFGNPAFVATPGAQASSLDTSRAGEGLVTGDVTLPAGAVFGPGRALLGQLQFDFLTGTNPLAGGLYFTNASSAATNLAFATNGVVLTAGAVVSPQLVPLTLAPALNRQSGLFEHVLQVAYPGAGTLENVDVLITGLGLDSGLYLIRVYNSIGLRTIGPDAEGYYENVPYFAAGSLAGGTSRNVTAEFYVSDHVTVPSPDYRLLVEPRTGFTVPSSATPLNITSARFVNSTFIIQWPSRSDYLYFVQYAPTTDDLVNNTTNARIVNPSVAGTGYAVQWIDNGPPKTESPPVDGSRFYRVLEVPAN